MNKNYEFKYRPVPTSATLKTAYPIEVTNRQFEYLNNRQKSVIQVLQPKYVYDYAREVQNYALNIPPQESFVNFQALISG